VLKKWHIYRLSLVVIILVTMFLVCYAAKDAAAFDGGIPISDIEMEETHGGFQMPNGNFVFFSMNLLQMDYLAYNNPAGTPDTDALTGILGSNLTPQIKQVEIGDLHGIVNSHIGEVSVENNIGLTSVAVALGNNITQKIWNIVDIDLLNFQVSNPDQIKPILSNFGYLVN
jgi:hypothetical protein